MNQSGEVFRSNRGGRKAYLIVGVFVSWMFPLAAWRSSAERVPANLFLVSP